MDCVLTEKCVKISMKPTHDVSFAHGMKVQEAPKAEYVGSILSSHANPTMEVNRRMAGVAFACRKRDFFGKHGNISKREKLLMYDAVVGTKLMYAMDTMPLAETQLRRLDGLYLKRDPMHTRVGHDLRANAKRSTERNKLEIGSSGKCIVLEKQQDKQFELISDRIRDLRMKKNV